MSTRRVALVLPFLVALASACASGTPAPAEPAARESAPGAAAAAGADTDGDGVPDKDDKCPDAKEDGVGTEPHDGCPNKPWSRQHGTPQ